MGGWVDGWMDGLVGGWWSHVKDCLKQKKQDKFNLKQIALSVMFFRMSTQLGIVVTLPRISWPPTANFTQKLLPGISGTV